MTLRNILLASGLCSLAAATAHAADGRIKTRLYNPDEIVVVEGRAGVQATIAFGEQEQIENVAIGDSTSWQVTPNKRADLLFVKPLGAKSRTNMTVVTDKHTYLFDLVAGSAATPLYVLRFSYPVEAKPVRQLAGAMSTEEAAAAATPPRDLAVADPADLNFAWRTKGERRILPSRIYDDGDATYLSWPARTAIPAILTRNEKGEEGAVNYAVRGDVLVLDSVPKTIVLRAGRDMAILENDRPATPPVAPPASSAEAPKSASTATALASVTPQAGGR
ncbi:TrbG/VirB9 family P-type conjugative transfer protein [Phenylobacterium deserti]|uniref:Type VI secretion protein n=1 Tax=Phenylobacterium deserti TaxID=1914756 RepID=A0A328AFJ2_9CAUL|nr:TrbG/VirB9 family P-type conjugative transfer protein [Phenylobacterium deserti]RAK52184.1 type VI secretion protein [Phenylobacterium deserti]